MRIYPPDGIDRATPEEQALRAVHRDGRLEGGLLPDRPGVWQGLRRMYGAKTRGGGGLPARRSRKHRGGRS